MGRSSDYGVETKGEKQEQQMGAEREPKGD